MRRSNSSQSLALRAIIFTVIVGAVLGAIAAAPARSLLSRETTFISGAADGAAGEPGSAYYYFPSQFAAPEGPVVEPMATF